jgi:AcrR family transcriptional regulator
MENHEPLLIELPLDGRRARSARSRARIAAAWRELIETGNPSPTATEVVRRAGVGLRTLYQHFDEMSALHHTAVSQFFAHEIDHRISRDYDGLSRAERIDAVVEARALVFESSAAMLRWTDRNECYSAKLTSAYDQWEAALRDDTHDALSDELIRLRRTGHQAMVVAIEAVLGWAHWDHLRRRRALDVKDAQDVVRVQLEALLAGLE